MEYLTKIDWHLSYFAWGFILYLLAREGEEKIDPIPRLLWKAFLVGIVVYVGCLTGIDFLPWLASRITNPVLSQVVGNWFFCLAIGLAVGWALRKLLFRLFAKPRPHSN